MTNYLSISWALLTFLLLAGCKDEPPVINQEEIIRLEIVNGTSQLEADGNSVIELKATIPRNAYSEYQTVTFLLSDAKLGSFVGTNADNTKVKVDATGVARTSLKVGRVPGVYYVSAQISKGDQTYKATDIPVTLTGLTSADRLKIIPAVQTPPADGFTSFQVTVQVKNAEEGEKVTLKSNLGGFLNTQTPKETTIDIDASGIGTALFRMSNEISPHVISGSLADGTTTSISIQPVESRPDTILVEPSALTVDTVGGSIQIKAILLKYGNIQKVSSNTQVFFKAYQFTESGTERRNVGRFTGLGQAFSNAEGLVTSVNFFADTGDINTKELIYIDVTTPNQENKILTTTIKIRAK